MDVFGDVEDIVAGINFFGLLGFGGGHLLCEVAELALLPLYLALAHFCCLL